ncbi:MAG: SRPBCC family protein [Candidatus Eiseniibacteriota bacterium]
MNPTTISIFRSFRAPVLDAWRALTRSEESARWLGKMDIELTHGGDWGLVLWNGDVARGRVISMTPPVKLELAWQPHPIAPESHVVLRLEGDGPGSRLTITHDGLKTEAERRAIRQMWKEALVALRTVLNEGADASEWGATIPVVARAAIPRSVSDLWPLLSTGRGIESWVAHVEHFDGVAGGSFRLTSKFQGREIVEEGRIEELAPESRVALSWEWMGENWGAPTRVEFTVEAEDAGSSVLIAHSGFDRVAPERRLAARRNYAAAWPEVLGDLKRLVAPIAA